MNVKGINTAAANAGGSAEGVSSPSSTGAMDSLLEKLRAAAPQARDQRDRRRRARLKDRHQLRIASGQTIPELGDLTKETIEDDESEKNGSGPNDSGTGDVLGEEKHGMAAISEGEDIADRAAMMLQGLRGDDDTDGQLGSQNGSLRIRRRRESADDERRNRRRKRATASLSAQSSAEDPNPSTIPAINHDVDSIPEESSSVLTPTTLVSPPTPESSQDKLAGVLG